MASIHTGWTLIDEFCGRWVYFLAGYLLAPRIFDLAAAAVAAPRLALAALLIWGGLATGYTLTGRILRSIA